MRSSPTRLVHKSIGIDQPRPIEQEELPFRVRIVRNENQLLKAVHIRSEAYGRHWPNLYESLGNPEPQDRNPNSLIFLAEQKNDNSAIGTMRIDTNLITPLPITHDIDLPSSLASDTIAYVTRLGVKQGRIGSLAKLTLFKSLHRYCLAKQISWILVGVHPPNDKDYLRLEFKDIFAPDVLVPIPSSFGIPLRFMAFEVVSAERLWRETKNPLYNFMFRKYHPDVEIFSSVSGMWSQPRRSQTRLSDSVNIFDDLGIPLI